QPPSRLEADVDVRERHDRPEPHAHDHGANGELAHAVARIHVLEPVALDLLGGLGLLLDDRNGLGCHGWALANGGRCQAGPLEGGGWARAMTSDFAADSTAREPGDASGSRARN